MANGMYFPSEKEFLNLTKQGNLIPVYREISGDLETPVSAYFKIAGKSKYSFLLESVEGEEKVARFSFLARDPEVVIQTKDGAVKVIRYAPGKKPSVQTAKVKDTAFVVYPRYSQAIQVRGPAWPASLLRRAGGVFGLRYRPLFSKNFPIRPKMI